MFAQMAIGTYKSVDLGTAHADDLIYLFDMLSEWIVPRSNNDLRFRDMLIDLWANFATTHKVRTKKQRNVHMYYRCKSIK